MGATYKPILHHRTKPDGTKHILIRITKNRKVSYLATNYYVSEKDWNDKKSEVRATSSMHAVYNAGIKKIIRNAQEIETNAELANTSTSAEQIKSKIQKKSSGTNFQYYASKFMEGNETAITKRTALLYQTHFKTIARCFSPEFKLEMFNEKTVAEYLIWLQNNYKGNTASRILRTVRMVYEHARDNEKVKGKNLFKNAKIKPSAVLKERLTMEEIQAIEDVSSLTKSESISRDVFLFQFYTGGIRISDVLALRKGDIKNNRIEIITEKTDKPQSRIIVEKAQQIISRYLPGLKSTDTVFPYMRNISRENQFAFTRKVESSTALINKNLKQLARKAGIQKNISSHIARHSFADQLRKAKVDPYTISKALGHSSIKTTEVYLAQFDNDAVDGAMNELFKK
jgi:integrase/recombinase XerD